MLIDHFNSNKLIHTTLIVSFTCSFFRMYFYTTVNKWLFDSTLLLYFKLFFRVNFYWKVVKCWCLLVVFTHYHFCCLPTSTLIRFTSVLCDFMWSCFVLVPTNLNKAIFLQVLRCLFVHFVPFYSNYYIISVWGGFRQHFLIILGFVTLAE